MEREREGGWVREAEAPSRVLGSERLGGGMASHDRGANVFIPLVSARGQ